MPRCDSARHRRRRAVRGWQWCALLLAAGCASDVVDDPDEPIPFHCELGLPGEGGALQPLPEGGPVELQIGFQGFLLIELQLRATGDVPATGRLAVSVRAEDRQPVGMLRNRVELKKQGDGYSTGPIVVFLTPAQIGMWKSREAGLAAKIEGEGRKCVAVASGVLVDEDPCIHTGDKPICPGDEAGK